MKTRRSNLLIMGIVLLTVLGFSVKSEAGIEVGVGISIPAFTFKEPPHLAVIPGTYAYFVPDADTDIIFYHGYWYRPFNGRWYRATFYNGPWAFMAPSKVPRVLFELPPGYRRIYAGHRPIAYAEFTRHWRTWERDRYWDRD